MALEKTPQSKRPIRRYRSTVIYRAWRWLRRAWRGRAGWAITSQLEEFGRYEVGKWTYGHPTVYDWLDGTQLRIGSFCSLHPTTNILLGGEHDPRCVTTYPIDLHLSPEGHKIENPVFPTSKGDVVIGHDVYIGIGSTILSGVSIGNGAVIAAGSMIVRDIPAYAIVGGNPAKVIKYRFEPAIIERLEKLAWWDWPDEKIYEARDLLLSPDVEAFLDKYENS